MATIRVCGLAVHHRGQLSALLTQAGQDVGVTDLLMMIPDAG